jgi:FAD synthetase
MVKVMAFGTFDILHPGHLSYLKQAKKYGDYLIVVVARDKNVLEIKKRLPRQGEKIRLAEIKKTGLADKVILGQLKNKLAVVEKFKPDVICLGYDQAVAVSQLEKAFRGEILRLKPFKKNIYKSSKIKKI